MQSLAKHSRAMFLSGADNHVAGLGNMEEVIAPSAPTAALAFLRQLVRSPTAWPGMSEAWVVYLMC